ncbi:hypothetical protein V6N12_033073 [Hibiscus sabdariffa]|uniref:Uncharacterized protein n=1 Tax=Hibiscus sabdariffa TaxID=183260 RepID=A0ABR2BD84_9ROSI
MAFSAMATSCSSLSLSHLQLHPSSILSKPYPFLFFPSSSRLNPKKRVQSRSSTRFLHLLSVSNTALDSSNRASIATESKDPSSSYGRRYFP